jgi:hypothetical protein
MRDPPLFESILRRVDLNCIPFTASVAFSLEFKSTHHQEANPGMPTARPAVNSGRRYLANLKTSSFLR